MGRKNPDTYTGTLSIADANQLATDNIRLAWKFIRKQAARGEFDPVEIESLILLALIHASRTFKPDKGFQFSTWCYAVFKKAITAHRIYQSRDKRRLIAIGLPRDRETDKLIPIPDGRDYAQEQREKMDRRKLLSVALTAIDAREYRVLIGRFVEDLTLEKLGEELGIGKERVRQIEAAALEKCLNRISRPGKCNIDRGRLLSKAFTLCA